jgi:hypothetical protein
MPTKKIQQQQRKPGDAKNPLVTKDSFGGWRAV